MGEPHSLGVVCNLRLFVDFAFQIRIASISIIVAELATHCGRRLGPACYISVDSDCWRSRSLRSTSEQYNWWRGAADSLCDIRGHGALHGDSWHVFAYLRLGYLTRVREALA